MSQVFYADNKAGRVFLFNEMRRKVFTPEPLVTSQKWERDLFPLLASKDVVK